MKKSIVILLRSCFRTAIISISIFCCSIAAGQELPPVKHFSSTAYNAENQNWDIAQSSDKIVYVANNKGLLSYNGAKWRLYPAPNESAIRTVLVNDARIYTGCYMDFGYWEKDGSGALNYISLSEISGVELLDDEEFWNIEFVKDWVVFQSLDRIFIYNTKDETISTIDSLNKITKLFKVGDQLYFQRINEGIFKFDDGNDLMLFDDDVVKTDEVVNIFNTGNELLIFTKQKGIFVSRNNRLLASDFGINESLKKTTIYDCIQLSDKSFAIGTTSHGLILIDAFGKLKYVIDKSNGLSNNTVLSVFEDLNKNIWLGLDNGINFINANSQIKEFNDLSGVIGSVYTSVIYESRLYLGTNQGLYYRDLDSTEEFKLIPGTNEQVWFLKVIDDTLFCGHNSGTFIIDGTMARKISDIQGAWDLKALDNMPGLLLQGNYDGLYVLEKKANNWYLKNKIEGFSNSSRYFEILGNEIFVNHEYNGVFKLTVNTSYSQISNSSIDSTLKGFNSGLVKYRGTIIYADENGILKYDPVKKSFIPDEFLSKLYSKEDYVSGNLVLHENGDKLWCLYI